MKQNTSKFSHTALVQGRKDASQTVVANDELSELVDVLRKTAQHLSSLLGVADCAVAVLDSTHTFLLSITMKQHQELAAKQIPFRWDESIEGWVIHYQKPLVLQDIAHDLFYQELSHNKDVGSLLCVPLLGSNGVCLGSLTIHDAQPAAFTEQTQHLLTVFASQVVLTLEASKQALQTHQVTSENMNIANFLSMITHELRSPLNAIHGYLDLALSGVGGQLTSQQQEFMQRARAGGEHLYALLEDLLLISRADAGQMRLHREIVHLPTIITNAVEEFELSARDQGVTIAVDVPHHFPRMYLDSVRMQQVLRNLISNSLRFTERDGTITISASVQEQYREVLHDADETNRRIVQLCVSDSGLGIAPEYHERIFERFFQVPTDHVTNSAGQGLGLAVVKMIVELHGGHVSIESAPGQGCTFICRLPCL